MNRVWRVLSVNLSLHNAEVDTLLQETAGRPLEGGGEINFEAQAHYRRSLEFEVRGKSGEALAEAERAAWLEPLAPSYQFRLGSLKTNLGFWRQETALTDEGPGRIMAGRCTGPCMDSPVD